MIEAGFFPELGKLIVGTDEAKQFWMDVTKVHVNSLEDADLALEQLGYERLELWRRDGVGTAGAKFSELALCKSPDAW